MRKINKILLIDDSRSSSEYNKVVLKEMAIADEIIIKNNADSALNYLKGLETSGEFPKPELILLDIMMPQMDGFMFMDKYIQLENEATNDFEILIAVVSDFLDSDNFEKSKNYKNYGLVDHIRKPLEKEDIINLIEDHLDD